MGKISASSYTWIGEDALYVQIVPQSPFRSFSMGIDKLDGGPVLCLGLTCLLLKSLGGHDKFR